MRAVTPLHVIDVAIIGLYVCWSTWSGLRARRVASRGLDEYFLAGRTLSGWSAGVSMAATQFAADTPLVVAGLVASAGVFSLWRLWIYALAFLLMALVLGAMWRRTGVLTDAELTELRYGPTRTAAILRGVKAVYLGIVFNVVVLAMVLLAATRVTEPFLLWHAWLPPALYDPLRSLVTWAGFALTDPHAHATPAGLWTAATDNAISIAALLGVTTLYSTAGGLRGVVRTDQLQFAIAIVATGFYAWATIAHVGGLEALGTRLAALYPPDGSGPGGVTAPTLLAFTPSEARDVGAGILGVIAIQWIAQINADGSGYLAQRTMACRSDRDAELAGVVFVLLQILIRSLVWLPIAVGLLVVFPLTAPVESVADVAAREATYVHGVVALLPAGALGLMITGMLGAFASTVDTHLNWGASYVTNDLWGRFLAPRVLGRAPSPRSLVWVARGTNLALVGLALLVMPALGSIRTAWHASLLLGAGVGVLLVLRWLWWRMNASAELAAILASAVAAPILLATVEREAWRLLGMAAIGTTTGLAAVRLAGPAPLAHLRAFHDRVRPLGWWGPVAGPGARSARAALGLRATAAGGSALSVFSLLVGAGTWLLGSPPPWWCPDRGAWIGACLAVGLGAIPLWAALLRRSRRPADAAGRAR